jgi:recombination protein RecR
MLPLMDLMQESYTKIKQCPVCGNLTTDEVCDICADHSRNREIVCVVETVADLWAIEGTGIYKGMYHILGGSLSASEGRTPADLNINSLTKRCKAGGINEVIIATNATIDGQTTAFYVADLLQQENGGKIKITKPAYGIPIGSEFNYLDEGTLDIAFKNKKEF